MTDKRTQFPDQKHWPFWKQQMAFCLSLIDWFPLNLLFIFFIVLWKYSYLLLSCWKSSLFSVTPLVATSIFRPVSWTKLELSKSYCCVWHSIDIQYCTQDPSHTNRVTILITPSSFPSGLSPSRLCLQKGGRSSSCFNPQVTDIIHALLLLYFIIITLSPTTNHIRSFD